MEGARCCNNVVVGYTNIYYLKEMCGTMWQPSDDHLVFILSLSEGELAIELQSCFCFHLTLSSPLSNLALVYHYCCLRHLMLIMNSMIDNRNAIMHLFSFLINSNLAQNRRCALAYIQCDLVRVPSQNGSLYSFAAIPSSIIFGTSSYLPSKFSL